MTGQQPSNGHAGIREVHELLDQLEDRLMRRFDQHEQLHRDERSKAWRAAAAVTTIAIGFGGLLVAVAGLLFAGRAS